MPPSDTPPNKGERDVLNSLPRTRPTRRSAKRDRPARGATTRKAAGTTPPEAPKAAAASDTPARSRARRASASKPASRPAAKTTAKGAAKPRPTAAKKPAAAAKPAARRSGARKPAARRAPAPAQVPVATAAAPPTASRQAGESGGGLGVPDPFAVMGTAVHAAGELAQIGATLWTQAVRSAIQRLPRL